MYSITTPLANPKLRHMVLERPQSVVDTSQYSECRSGVGMRGEVVNVSCHFVAADFSP